MAIAPQRRISKTRKRQRRSHFKLELPGMMVCPNCGEVKLAHVVCEKCGYYDGKLVREIKVKNDEADETVETKAEAKAKAKVAKKEDKAAKKTTKKEETK